jgi:hypothetical protein
MSMKLIAFAIACMAVSGCSRLQSRTGASTQGGAQAASKDPSPAGIAECDDYMRMVSQCIETKVPESERASERQKLANFRIFARNPMMRSLAGPKCKSNIVTAIRYDRYDCYAGEGVKRGIRTPCTLLTRAELEQILQTPLEDGTLSGNECIYGFAGNPARHPFRITVHWKDAPDYLTAARGAQALVKGRLEKETGMSGFVSGARVDGWVTTPFLPWRASGQC